MPGTQTVSSKSKPSASDFEVMVQYLLAHPSMTLQDFLTPPKGAGLSLVATFVNNKLNQFIQTNYSNGESPEVFNRLFNLRRGMLIGFLEKSLSKDFPMKTFPHLVAKIKAQLDAGETAETAVSTVFSKEIPLILNKGLKKFPWNGIKKTFTLSTKPSKIYRFQSGNIRTLSGILTADHIQRDKAVVSYMKSSLYWGVLFKVDDKLWEHPANQLLSGKKKANVLDFRLLVISSFYTVLKEQQAKTGILEDLPPNEFWQLSDDALGNSKRLLLDYYLMLAMNANTKCVISNELREEALHALQSLTGTVTEEAIVKALQKPLNEAFQNTSHMAAQKPLHVHNILKQVIKVSDFDLPPCLNRDINVLDKVSLNNLKEQCEELIREYLSNKYEYLFNKVSIPNQFWHEIDKVVETEKNLWSDPPEDLKQAMQNKSKALRAERIKILEDSRFVLSVISECVGGHDYIATIENLDTSRGFIDSIQKKVGWYCLSQNSPILELVKTAKAEEKTKKGSLKTFVKDIVNQVFVEQLLTEIDKTISQDAKNNPPLKDALEKLRKNLKGNAPNADNSGMKLEERFNQWGSYLKSADGQEVLAVIQKKESFVSKLLAFFGFRTQHNIVKEKLVACSKYLPDTFPSAPMPLSRQASSPTLIMA